MEFTQELFDRYVGGQLEVHNKTEDYRYRGEIASLELSGPQDFRQLTVHFKWFAKLDMSTGWQAANPDPYEISLPIYSVSDIGADRICLSSPVTGETTVLFPPGGSRLDPAKVHGLAAGS